MRNIHYLAHWKTDRYWKRSNMYFSKWNSIPIKPTQNSNYPTQKNFSEKKGEKNNEVFRHIYILDKIWYSIIGTSLLIQSISNLWLYRGYFRNLCVLTIFNFHEYHIFVCSRRTYKTLCDILRVSLKRERRRSFGASSRTLWDMQSRNKHQSINEATCE